MKRTEISGKKITKKNKFLVKPMPFFNILYKILSKRFKPKIFYPVSE